MPELTLKQRYFAHAYVSTGNLETAAKTAEISAEEAADWLNEPDVQAVIVHDKLAATTCAMETRDTIIARYAVIANADIADYFEPAAEAAIDEDGNKLPGMPGVFLKPFEQLTKEQRMCIKKIKHTQHGVELELYDRLRANDRLAEIFKVITDDSLGETAEEKAKQIRNLLQEMEDVTTGVVTH